MVLMYQNVWDIELFSLLRFKTPSSLRGVFIKHGEMFTLTESEKLHDAPKMIARFCPPALGMCIVAYVADILPFDNLLSVAGGREYHGSASLPFSGLSPPVGHPTTDEPGSQRTRKRSGVT
jgi:hypothetical protein